MHTKLRPQIGCHGNIPQHHWTPSNMIPWAHPSPQPQRSVQLFCTDDRRVPILYNGMHLSPSKLPLPWGIWTPI